MGPKTGGGFGVCGGTATTGFYNRGFGFGPGYGFRGSRRGFAGQGVRRRYARRLSDYAPTVRDEMDGLAEEARYLEDALSRIKRRISELEKEVGE